MKYIKKYKSIIIMFILIFLLSIFFPFSSDDWYWGSKSINISELKNIYNDLFLNGRWLGNIFSIIMAKNHILKALIISIILTSLVYLISRKEKINIKSMCLFFILLIPIVTFSQCFIWGSGFANYTISTLIYIIIYYLIKKYYKCDKSFNFYNYFFISFIGIISCLFLENVTISILFILFLINSYFLYKNKRINIPLFILFISSIIGAILMFMHPGYYNLLFSNVSVNDRYIPTDIYVIFDTIKVNSKSILYYLINEYLLFNIYIIYIFYRYLEKKNNIKLRLILFYLVFMISLVLSYIDINSNVLLILNIIYIIMYIDLLLKLTNKDKNIILLVVMIASLILPLFIIKPISSRLFFLPYLLNILIINRVKCRNKIEFKNSRFINLTIILMYLFFLICSICNLLCEYQMKKYIDNEINRSSNHISVPNYPFEGIIWNSNFADSVYFRRCFNEYHGYNLEIEYERIDYKTWIKLYRKSVD